MYLKDLEFYLRDFPNATSNHRIYLIKVTFNITVNRFLERQPDRVRKDYALLRQALEKEFSVPSHDLA